MRVFVCYFLFLATVPYVLSIVLSIFFSCIQDTGVLRADEFSRLDWESNPSRAQLSDILRVHDYNYVQKLGRFSISLAAPPRPRPPCNPYGGGGGGADLEDIIYLGPAFGACFFFLMWRLIVENDNRGDYVG